MKFIILISALLGLVNPFLAVALVLYIIIIKNDMGKYISLANIGMGLLLTIIGMRYLENSKLIMVLINNITFFSNHGLLQAITLILKNVVNYNETFSLLITPIGVILITIGVINLNKYKLLRVKIGNSIIRQSKDTDNKENGVYFGADVLTNRQVVVNDEELNQHALVIGTTGSGKTTTLMNIVESCCLRGIPLIYVDGKGSISLANRVKYICEKYNRVLKVFSLDSDGKIPNLSYYNPFGFGNFTEWKNKIITLTQEAEGKGQEHYSLKEQSYISLLCEILNKSGAYVDLEGIIAYIKAPDELQKLANRISPELGMRLINARKYTDESDIIKVLESFYYSHYGKLFSTNERREDEVINLSKCIKNKEIVLFLLDAASYKRDTNLLGRLIINDINSVWAGFGRSEIRYKGYCIFDEFASYAASNMANVLSMQRDNGLHAIVGTQSINAISVESSNVKRVAVELIANCNTFFLHKLNDPKDIELLVNTIGTRDSIEMVKSQGATNSSLRLSTKISEKLLIKPQCLRELKAGYGFVCRTVSGATLPVKVRFNLV